MTQPVALVWFRDDLRLDDNPALRAAVEGGYRLLPVYIHAPAEEGDWAPGQASNAWRHRSLAALHAQLAARGAGLRLFHGPTQEVLDALVSSSGAQAVFWNRRYEPAVEARDTRIKRHLRGLGLRAESFNGALLFEPWQVETQAGDPYKVFTPFWKRATASWRAPVLWDAPERLPGVGDDAAIPHGVHLDALQLMARPQGWDAGFWRGFSPGEAGARAALSRLLAAGLAGYDHRRDLPAEAGTSRLSAHLHFGEVSVARAAAAVRGADVQASAADVQRFLAELGWREFSHHLLHHFPQTAQDNLNPRFDDFPWARLAPAKLEAWKRGMTGVPIVDAGMRELWQTGWMHNRVRMIAASYLTKHLRMHWVHGARWFWDTLVDADLANNTQGWQWTAGTGADAAPYFRIFNPVTQAKRFDPDGVYIAQWVPELADLPLPLRFAPWEDAGRLAVVAPRYPRRPIVDLAKGRADALAAWAQVSGR